MVRNFIIIAVLVVSVGLLCGLLTYIIDEEDKVCNELVIMNDGTQIEAIQVASYNNGMSSIQMCGGEWIDIPTLNIKMVKHIEK
jgi:hypothetical protein